LSLAHLPGSEKETREAVMAKIDLDSLNIEELAALRERIVEKLAEKVASRQVELEAEMERLSQYGKPSKKSQAAPAVKAKKSDEKSDEKKSDEAREPQDPISDAAEAA
jgi:DNA-binding protein H-NS